jgi:F0F1-type ATP synthase membrane subunit c/vacuolar-type H+-ATPase subunit K
VSAAPDDLRQACRRAQVVGASLVLAVVIYAVVVETFARGSRPFRGLAPDAPVGIIRLLLVLSAIANLVVSRVLRGKLTAAALRGAGPGATSAGQRMFVQSLLEMAMTEAIAIYGLVLFLVGGQPLDFYGFAAVALIVLASQFPRLSRWEDQAREPRPPLA